MKRQGHQMRPDEARRLLGLNGCGSLARADVEKAYKSAIPFWSRQILNPRTHDERDRANDMLKLLMQARDVLLASPVPSSGSGATAPAATNDAWKFRPVMVRTPSTVAMRKAGGHARSAIVQMFKSLGEWFRFVCALPGVFVEIKDCLVAFVEAIVQAGIPRIVVILVLILGLMTCMQGCVGVIGRIIQGFR